MEATGHRAVADTLSEQSERQQDSVRQGQASPSGQSSPGFRALEQVCNTLIKLEISEGRFDQHKAASFIPNKMQKTFGLTVDLHVQHVQVYVG